MSMKRWNVLMANNFLAFSVDITYNYRYICIFNTVNILQSHNT